MKFDVEYREKGVIFCKTFDIDFISQKIIRDYHKMYQVILDTQKMADEWSDHLSVIASLEAKREKGYKKEVKKVEEKIEVIRRKLAQYTDSSFAKDRYELIKRILLDNCEMEEKFLSEKFWDESVDANETTIFLRNVVSKDVKKKSVTI